MPDRREIPIQGLTPTSTDGEQAVAMPGWAE
jgi:hypothetical protein